MQTQSRTFFFHEPLGRSRSTGIIGRRIELRRLRSSRVRSGNQRDRSIGLPCREQTSMIACGQRPAASSAAEARLWRKLLRRLSAGILWTVTLSVPLPEDHADWNIGPAVERIGAASKQGAYCRSIFDANAHAKNFRLRPGRQAHAIPPRRLHRRRPATNRCRESRAPARCGGVRLAPTAQVNDQGEHLGQARKPAGSRCWI